MEKDLERSRGWGGVGGGGGGGNSGRAIRAMSNREAAGLTTGFLKVLTRSVRTKVLAWAGAPRESKPGARMEAVAARGCLR